MAEARILRVLVADGLVDRSNTFRMVSQVTPKPSFLFRIVRTRAALEDSLKTERWDVLLHFVFLGKDDHEALTTLPMIVEAYKKGTLDYVLVTSAVVGDGSLLTKELRKSGVPAKYFPYTYTNPSEHKEFSVSEPLNPRVGG